MPTIMKVSDKSKSRSRLKLFNTNLKKNTEKLKNIKPTKQAQIKINVQDSHPIIYKGGKNTRKKRKKEENL